MATIMWSLPAAARPQPAYGALAVSRMFGKAVGNQTPPRPSKYGP